MGEDSARVRQHDKSAQPSFRGYTLDTFIAGVSAALSLAALIVAALVARSQTAIQFRLAAIEEARRAEEVASRAQARVTARFTRGQVRPNEYGGFAGYVVLRNEGAALARDVTIFVEPGEDVPEVLGLEDLPVDLQPGQPLELPVVMVLGDATSFDLSVRWADESGNHEEPFTLSTL
jgi:hypothetical protein